MCLNCVLALYHEKLDLDPHIEWLERADDVFIFAEMFADLFARNWHSLAVVRPELVYQRLTADVKPLRAHHIRHATAPTKLLHWCLSKRYQTMRRGAAVMTATMIIGWVSRLKGFDDFFEFNYPEAFQATEHLLLLLYLIYDLPIKAQQRHPETKIW